jgi:hypothetical protein
VHTVPGSGYRVGAPGTGPQDAAGPR